MERVLCDSNPVVAPGPVPVVQANLLSQRAHHAPRTVLVEAVDPGFGGAYREHYDAAAAARPPGHDHSLALDTEPVVYETSFRVRPSQQHRWERLFGATPAAGTPFSYYTTAGSVVLLRLLGDLGVNLRHLLHLQTCATHVTMADIGERCRLRVRLDRVTPLAEDRAALVVEVEVASPEGRVRQTVREVFAVLHLPAGWERAVASSPLFDASSQDLLLGRPVRRAGPVQHISIDIPSDLGLRYAEVSGDLNTHGAELGSGTPTGPRPFIQGLCTANLVLAQLARHHCLAGLVVRFARPVYVAQRVDLLVHDDGFELRDEAGRLVAFGAQRYAATEDQTRSARSSLAG